MATLEEIGQATKAKYPQYAGKTDTEVGQAIVDKYPEYKAKLDTRSGVQKVSDFIGLGNVAKTLTTAIQSPIASKMIDKQDQLIQSLSKQSLDLIKQAKLEKDPTKKQALLQQSRELDSQIDGAGNKALNLSDIVRRGAQVTDKEMGMSNAEFAGRRGTANAAEIASYSLPGLLGVGTTAGTRIGVAAQRGAVAGGLQGAARGTGADTLGEAAGDTALGALIGAGTGAAIQGTFEAVGGIANAIKSSTGKARDKLVDVYKNTLKQNIRDKKFYQQYGGEDQVVKDAVKYNVPSTKAGVEKELQKYGSEYNREIQRAAAQLDKDGKSINIAKAFENARQRVKSRLGYDESLLKSANRWFADNAKKYANQTSAKPISSNRLRVSLDEKIGDVLTPDAYGSDAARKAFATELRAMFKEMAPAKTRDAIRRYHLLSGLSDAMQKEPIISLPEVTGSAITTMASGGNPLAGLLGLVGTKAIRSPGLRRAIVSGASRVPSASVNVSQINSTPVINPMVSALQRIIDKEKNYKTSSPKLPSSTQ